MNLGKRLKQLRIQKGLSQERLAGIIGISRSALSMYELNQREPDVNTIIKFADFFAVSTDYLLGRENEADIDKAEAKESLRELIRMVIKEVQEEYSSQDCLKTRTPKEPQ